MHGEGLPVRRFKRGTSPLYGQELSLEKGPHERALETAPQRASTETAPLYVAVPLPTEIPEAPNLEMLPAQVLHSGTVETLIGQNEDLMARLKVNLRRNALLEQQIIDLESQLAELKQLNSSLRDQVEIVQEKDRVWKEKNLKVEARSKSLQDEIALLQTRLEQMGAAARDKQAALQELARTQAALTNEQSRTRELTNRIERMETEIGKRDALVGELRLKVNDLQTHIQNQGRSAREDQARLVEEYETRLQKLSESHEHATRDLAFFRERAQKADELSMRQVESENRAVLLERKNKELERKLNTEVAQMQTAVATYRAEAKALAVEFQSAREDKERFEAEARKARQERETLRDQLESLQALWTETRKRNEELELRMEGLNAINQELSRKLKEDRLAREAAALGLMSNRRGASTQAAESNIADAEPGKSNATEARPETESEAIHQKRKAETAEERAKFDRLDSLLMTIESGFPLSRAPEARHARSLELIENQAADADGKAPESAPKSAPEASSEGHEPQSNDAIS